MKNRAGYIGSNPDISVGKAAGIWSISEIQPLLRSGDWGIAINGDQGISINTSGLGSPEDHSGRARLWCVTEKKAGDKLIGSIRGRQTSIFHIKWWDGSIVEYSDTFTKVAAGGKKAFEILIGFNNQNTTESGVSFSLKNNDLIWIQPDNWVLESAQGYDVNYRFYPYTWSTAYWYRSNYIYGESHIGDVSNNNLSAAALDAFYTGLLTDNSGSSSALIVSGNPGVGSDTTSIATNKGYTVYGSVPEEVVMLLRFNGNNGSTTITDSSPLNLSYTATGGARLSRKYSKFGPTSLEVNNGYVSSGTTPDIPSLNDGQFTIESWNRVVGHNMYLGWGTQTTLHLNNKSSVTGGFHFCTLNAGGTTDINDGQTATGKSADFRGYEDRWVHMVAAYDGHWLSVYINGRLLSMQKQGPYGTGSYRAFIGKYACWNAPNWSACGDATDNLYIDSIRVTKGRCLCSNSFVPPQTEFSAVPKDYEPGITELLLNFNKSESASDTVSADLLLNMNGDNNSTTFTDSGPRGLACVANGNAKISTTQSKFGGASGYFDGTGDYVSIAYNADLSDFFDFVSHDDFTIEMWIRFDSVTGGKGICGQSNGGGIASAKSKWGLYFNDTSTVGAGKIGLWWRKDGQGTAYSTKVNWSPSINTWYHLAVCRSGFNYYFFVDGTSIGTDLNAHFPSRSQSDFRVGMDGENYKTFAGYIDDFRIVRGYALYTANFTAPAAALTSTVSLGSANPSSVLQDGGHNSISPGVRGALSISSTQSKFGGESAYFDGTGNTFIHIPNIDSRFDMWADDFTVECWFYLSAWPSADNYRGLICNRNTETVTGFLLSAYSTNGSSAKFRAFVSNDDRSAWNYNFEGPSISLNTWYHCSIVRHNTSFAFYFNGNREHFFETTGLFPDGGIPFWPDSPTQRLFVGCGFGTNGSSVHGGQPWNGYIDDVRIVRGKALYTDPTYTPPDAELKRYPN